MVYLGFSIFAVFTVALFIANIYCYKKERYLVLYIICFLFLPDYYGIVLTESLPVITPGRVMWLIFIIYVLRHRKSDEIKTLLLQKKRFIFLIAYFLLRIVSNSYYLFTYTQSVKNVIELVIHCFIYVIGIVLLSPIRSEIDELIEAIVNVATLFFVIGVLESFAEFRLFDFLYIADKAILNEHFYRMGILRATASFGLPGIYGNMCLLMMPLILYCYHLKNNKRYLLYYGLSWIAIVFSGSRADFMFAFVIAMVYFFYSMFIYKERRSKLTKNFAVIIGGIILFVIVTGGCSKKLNYFYTGTLKSVLNEVGFDFDLDEGAPETVEGYGENKDGTYSRIRQLTGIVYTLHENPLFGLGAGAQIRKDIKYIKNGEWRASGTYDMGIVQIVADEGLIGLIGYVCLIVFLINEIKVIYYYERKTAEFLSLLVLAYLLSTLSTANMDNFLMFIYGLVIIIRNAVCEKNEKKDVIAY